MPSTWPATWRSLVAPWAPGGGRGVAAAGPHGRQRCADGGARGSPGRTQHAPLVTTFEFARAADLLGEAEAAASAANDAGALAYARLHQGYVAAFQGDADLAAARGEETLATYQAIPQEFSVNGALWLLASAALMRRENDQATDFYQRLLITARAEGDDISLANSLHGLAILAQRGGELGRRWPAMPRQPRSAVASATAFTPAFVSMVWPRP